MADPLAKMTSTTPQEVVVAVVGGLLAPLLAIYLVVQLILGIQAKHVDTDTSEAANKATLERIAPFAKLAAVDANAPKAEKSGEEVFTAVCASCHTAGALGAPKFKNAGDWAPRIKQGYDTLLKHALEGIRQMPARGGNPDLSDTEVARAVAYMANAAGAKFKEPEAAAPAAGTAAGGAKIDLAKGKTTYAAVCVACHGVGVAGAPKFGDKAAWAPRVKTGFDALYQSALKGKNAMPAKGGKADLAETDLASAVAYMVKEAGGTIPASVPGAAAKPEKTSAAPAEKSQAAQAASAPAPAKATPAVAVAAAKPAAAKGGKGEAVYKQTCAMCHAAGVAGAPKFGDKGAWAPRVAKGMDALYASGLKGRGAMPAKGGNPTLADADVKAAIDYMVGKAK